MANMSVTMQEHKDEPLVHSQFNLPTHQRRLRHLQSITARNLVCPNSKGIDIIKLQVYFTLHKDTKSKAFYTSEKITGSLNPTWQSFDLQRNDSDTDLASKFVVVRVWSGNQNDFQLKIEWQVHLSGLVLFSDKLQVSGLKHAPDTLLFGMYNHIYCYLDPDVANPQLEQLVPDTQIPGSQNLHAVLMDRSILRPSYNVSYLSRIHTVLRAIKQTHASVRRIHSTIEDKLVSSKERSDKLTQREALLIRMRQLRQELLWQQHQKQKDEDELTKHQDKNKTWGNKLKGQRTSLTEFCSASEEKRLSHIQYREMLVKENAQVMFRRRQLISEMVHHIYPIKKNEKEEFFICNVRLPNAEEYQGNDENMLASALGFVCHLTLMVSQYMDTPLRYPMIHRGSRSMIVDHVHSKLADKDREFPLFGKGKEKFQYNYGVFLLNKNISQMRFYCGLGTSDLRQTLSNLKSLLEQRLGLGPSSPSRGPYSTTSTHITPSLENSLASHMSVPPSSSSSSFIPHNYHHQHHHHHHHHHHHQNHLLHHASDATADNNPSARTFDLSTLEIQNRPTTTTTTSPGNHDSPLIFKNSREDSSNSSSANNSNNQTSAMTSSFSSWIESASKMTMTAHNNKNNSGNVRNGDKSRGGDEVRAGKDDDEKDDLFQSSEDSFFSSGKIKKPTELFTNGAVSSATPATTTTMSSTTDSGNQHEHEDHGAFVSTTLSPTPHRSFKLVKQPPQSNNGVDDKSSPATPPSQSTPTSTPSSASSPSPSQNTTTPMMTITTTATTNVSPSATPVSSIGRTASAAVPIPGGTHSVLTHHPHLAD